MTGKVLQIRTDGRQGVIVIRWQPRWWRRWLGLPGPTIEYRGRNRSWVNAATCAHCRKALAERLFALYERWQRSQKTRKGR